MSFTILKKTVDRAPEVEAAIEYLGKTRIMVGVPADTAARAPEPGETTTPNNAEIAYIMENGAPELKIPARPFMKPGIEGAKAAIVDGLTKAGRLALDGKMQAVDARMAAVGTLSVRAIQQKMEDGPFAPLARRTIQARAERGRKGAKKYLKQLDAGETPDAGLVKPLLDTGKLRAAITYVIRTIAAM